HSSLSLTLPLTHSLSLSLTHTHTHTHMHAHTHTHTCTHARSHTLLVVSEEATKWMKSYLADRTQSVHFGSSFSPYLSNNIGVPQGSVLGPILFSMYITD